MLHSNGGRCWAAYPRGQCRGHYCSLLLLMTMMSIYTILIDVIDDNDVNIHSTLLKFSMTQADKDETEYKDKEEYVAQDFIGLFWWSKHQRIGTSRCFAISTGVPLCTLGSGWGDGDDSEVSIQGFGGRKERNMVLGVIMQSELKVDMPTCNVARQQAWRCWESLRWNSDSSQKKSCCPCKARPHLGYRQYLICGETK